MKKTGKRIRKKKITELLETIESFYDELHSEKFYGIVMSGCIILLSIMVLVLVCLAVVW